MAPATAMFKPFCFGNLSLEKPFKDGLNFFKMSEEKRDIERFIDEHAQPINAAENGNSTFNHPPLSYFAIEKKNDGLVAEK